MSTARNSVRASPPLHHANRQNRTKQTDGSDSSSSGADSSKTIRSFQQSRTRAAHTNSAVANPPGQNRTHGGAFLPPCPSSSVTSPSHGPPARTFLGNSRPTSPFFAYNNSEPSSSCSSDTDIEPSAMLLRSRSRGSLGRRDRHGWWSSSSSSSRGRGARRSRSQWYRTFRKWSRRLGRHPCVPRQPITIVLTLLALSIFALFLTLLLIHIFNPDKEPLPWRAYCAFGPQPSTPPTEIESAYPYNLMIASEDPPMPFPPPELETLPPAAIFLAIFSVDSAFERRMLVRDSWARHPRSRNGGGGGDGGNGTSRTIVRFILGQSRSNWDAQVKLEMELYNDIVILPTPENMNGGKTHTFFQWAAIHAWVPPDLIGSSKTLSSFSYANITGPPQRLAPHDPIQQHREAAAAKKQRQPWTRPDFVVKMDDDSFVMLAELETRLRVQLYSSRRTTQFPVNESSMILGPNHLQARTQARMDHPGTSHDPLIYWGYLVKNRFMAGELYALTWSLVTWAAHDIMVAGMTKGAEDKQTAKWMQRHPRAAEVQWVSERCWIYDHPRSGTVYSHGFLYPSEAARVQKSFRANFDRSLITPPLPELKSQAWGVVTQIPRSWSHSTVAKFGLRYQPALPELTTNQQMEALVEGSELSMLHENSAMSPDYAWQHREGRATRYKGQRVGGTVLVHFIKKNLWYLETAEALLEGLEYTEMEAKNTKAGQVWAREQALLKRKTRST